MNDYFKHETAIIEGKKIGKGTKIWHHSHIRDGAELGENCVIAKNVYIDFDVKIHNKVKIGNNVSVYNAELMDDVFIGPSVTFTNDLRPRAFIWNESRKGQRTIVEKCASIGANATIISGVRIGEYAMVGAGSVVTKNVPSYALVYGNPAKIKGKVNKEGEKIKE
ncbi:MAG: acyltransferase [Candidatus Diapherotrites archaeon]